MAQDTPTPEQRKRKKRRKLPPPKMAWHDHPWVLPGILGACGLMVVVVGALWWKQRAPADPVVVSEESNQEIQESVQDYYKGNYALLDHNTLAKEKLLPQGLQVPDDANELRSAWGRVELMGSNNLGVTQPPYDHFIIVYRDIPQQVCPQLAAQLMAQYPKVWIGQKPPVPVDEEVVAGQADIAAKCQKSATLAIMALGK